MKENVKLFLDSDVLERYLTGETSQEETLRAERYITLYREVREVYDMLQDNLEAFAKMYARKTPEGFKAILLNSVKKEKATRRKSFRYTIAASVALMIFASSSYFFWDQHKNLQQDSTQVTRKIAYLEEHMKDQLEEMRNQFIVFNNPNTKTYTVQGENAGKELKAIAYINPVKKLSYINVSNVPSLPENQCFQMWAEVNGELVNLGTIKQRGDKDKLLALPYADNAVGYITVEPECGNTSPSFNNIVANINY